MSLVSSEQHQRFRAQVQREVKAHVLPHFDDWERDQRLPRSVFEACGEAGLIGLLVPRKWGGAELDYSYSVVLTEELMKAMAPSIAISLLLSSNTICPILVRHASPDIQNGFLPELVKGKLIVSLCITEPAGGSDLLESLHCSALSDGDHWIINGEKMFITNGPIADVLFVLARTSEMRGALSMSLIAVPADTPGYSVLQQHEKLGLHASPTGWLRFNQCRVPKSNTIGKINCGYIYFSEAISEERLLISVGGVAFAKACFEQTVDFLRSRRGNGEALFNYEAVRRELGSMLAEIEACKAFVYSAASQVCQGVRDPAKTAIAKFAVSEISQRIIRRCVEMCGSDGFCEGTWMARAIRDARILSVIAGTSETMRDFYSTTLVRKMHLASLRGRELTDAIKN